MTKTTAMKLGRKHGASIKVSIETSEYQTPQPTIEVQFPAHTPFRQLRALLHGLAMKVELASGQTDGWVVEIGFATDERGFVYLDLVDGTDAEAQRGLAVLQSVVR